MSIGEQERLWTVCPRFVCWSGLSKQSIIRSVYFFWHWINFVFAKKQLFWIPWFLSFLNYCVLLIQTFFPNCTFIIVTSITFFLNFIKYSTRPYPHTYQIYLDLPRKQIITYNNIIFNRTQFFFIYINTLHTQHFESC